MLTFDKIRDMERMEKQSKKLQKLPDDMIGQLREYIKRKERINEKTSSDITELENIKTTIKRLFELREAKIISSSLDTVRTGLPPENMSKDEEALFYRLTDELKLYREQFFAELGKEVSQSSMYRVRKTLPPFVGPDMKTYALKENDIINIPSPLEELLLKEGVIEKAS